MKLNSRLHHYFAWLACLAMVFAVLAPTVSRAQSESGWVEICTVEGMKRVKMTDAETGQKPTGSLIHGEHCPFCATHIDLAGPVPHTLVLLHPAEWRVTLPRLYFQAPRPLHTWAPAQSRAPPVLS